MKQHAAIARGTALALAGAALVSCADYQARQEQEAKERAQAQWAAEDAQCRSYGAEPGSPAYVQCRMNIDNQNAQMRSLLAAKLLSRM